MKWSCSKSIRLTRIMIMIFLALLVAMDCGGMYLSKLLYDTVYSLNREIATVGLILGLIYVCSIPAYVTLYCLYRLIANIDKGQVFVVENVSALRLVSWCCIFVSGVCFLSGVMIWYTLLLVSAAAGFMALIVRVVKNIFEQAIEMKDELDFTI